ncbi:MAG TPA: NUDIX hydrolase [Actinomycetota bacterium]|nr:NUDIX hydrolase [Actinomycetota bacterium]
MTGPPGAFARYAKLASERPELFANPAGSAFRILLDAEEIAAAEGAEADRLAGRGLPREWARVGVVYEDEYVLLLRDAVAFPDGHRGTYIRFVGRDDAPSGVAVLPLHAGKVLLVRHFRHATRSSHLEIPRGFWVDGLSGTDIARRELEEEAGIAGCTLVPLGPVHVNTGLTAETLELYAALVEDGGRPSEDQAITEVVAVGVDELEELIRDGEVTDSFTVAAYARAKLRGVLGSGYE